ncbi:MULTISPECIES: hypothetical protein [Nocardioides]|uniref:DUF2530 domain-containing protein n=1 Tax=Nocardioides vastitatis TaxID=2568655 RepID=A0ABW0ZG39_9ACTN|nr:hypothetical protein [Nocardioides sp.]THI92537.1 hypothetical protein E7Z54_21790 [Nocardioides sp.]
MSTYDDLGPELPREARPADPPWHPVNVGHLVMGVAFLGLAAVWALLASDTVQLENARWLLPMPWLVAGALGLATTVLRGRRRGRSGRMAGWHQDSPSSQG